MAFWDKEGISDTLVIATHGVIKKTAKIPKSEIDKAEGLRQKYFKDKRKKK